MAESRSDFHSQMPYGYLISRSARSLGSIIGFLTNANERSSPRCIDHAGERQTYAQASGVSTAAMDRAAYVAMVFWEIRTNGTVSPTGAIIRSRLRPELANYPPAHANFSNT